MKNAILIVLFCFATVSVNAQNSNVNKANANIQNGKLAEAKELIDQAAEHEKTREKGRTWYVRGMVYQAIASSDDESVRAIDPGAAIKAAKSYEKVKIYEKEGSNYYTLSEIQAQQMYSIILNRGISLYQEENYKDAYLTFKDLTIIAPKDTIGYLYGGYCAQEAGELDDAFEMYYSAMELEDCPKLIYTQVMFLLENDKQDLEGALKIAHKGMEKFPDDQSFDKSIIAYYIKLEKTDEARQALIAALEVEPENANLWYNLGYLNGEIGAYDESVEAYKKAIEADPEYIDPYINLAYTYTSKAKEIRQEAMDMDLKTYQKEGAPIEAKADEYYKLALPVLEKANEVQPDDQAILESLSGLYIRLKMMDKAEAVQKKLVELGYWEDN